jgi:ABC-type sulfate/molybdate transport systems ATPase subunit
MRGLELRAVRKKISDFELRADFAVGAGERLALVGRSGSGKTSLLRLIAGLDPLGPGGGNILLGGIDLGPCRPEKRRIGFVFQDQALFPSLTVLENAAFGLRVRGVDQIERRRRAMHWLRKIGMEDLANATTEKLSGGERQRLAVVRAMVWDPDLLLLDEPFSAMDLETRGRLVKDLLRLLSERPLPVVLVTHELADIEALSTRKIEAIETERGRVREFKG